MTSIIETLKAPAKVAAGVVTSFRERRRNRTTNCETEIHILCDFGVRRIDVEMFN